MKVAVRYCSQFGRTKAIAEEMATELGVEAKSITDEPELTEHTDVLFLGGAPYVNVMAPALEAYVEKLEPGMVGKVVLFTTSNWSRRTVLALRKALTEKGISVSSDHFYAHMTQIEARKPAARDFARRQMGAIATRGDGLDVPAIAAESIAATTIIVGAIAVAVFAITRAMRRK